MASTVMAVLDAAGAWVTLMIAQSPTMKSATITVSGKTTPIPITTHQDCFSPGWGSSESAPKPRRPRRTHAQTSRPVMSARPPKLTAIITQKRFAMSVAAWLCGLSALCEPPQPASSVGKSSAVAASPLRRFVPPSVPKPGNGYPSVSDKKP